MAKWIKVTRHRVGLTYLSFLSELINRTARMCFVFEWLSANQAHELFIMQTEQTQSLLVNLAQLLWKASVNQESLA